MKKIKSLSILLSVSFLSTSGLTLLSSCNQKKNEKQYKIVGGSNSLLGYSNKAGNDTKTWIFCDENNNPVEECDLFLSESAPSNFFVKNGVLNWDDKTSAGKYTFKVTCHYNDKDYFSDDISVEIISNSIIGGSTNLEDEIHNSGKDSQPWKLIINGNEVKTQFELVSDDKKTSISNIFINELGYVEWTSNLLIGNYKFYVHCNYDNIDFYSELITLNITEETPIEFFGGQQTIYGVVNTNIKEKNNWKIKYKDQEVEERYFALGDDAPDCLSLLNDNFVINNPTTELGAVFTLNASANIDGKVRKSSITMSLCVVKDTYFVSGGSEVVKPLRFTSGKDNLEWSLKDTQGQIVPEANYRHIGFYTKDEFGNFVQYFNSNLSITLDDRHLKWNNKLDAAEIKFYIGITCYDESTSTSFVIYSKEITIMPYKESVEIEGGSPNQEVYGNYQGIDDVPLQFSALRKEITDINRDNLKLEFYDANDLTKRIPELYFDYDKHVYGWTSQIHSSQSTLSFKIKAIYTYPDGDAIEGMSKYTYVLAFKEVKFEVKLDTFRNFYSKYNNKWPNGSDLTKGQPGVDVLYFNDAWPNIERNWFDEPILKFDNSKNEFSINLSNNGKKNDCRVIYQRIAFSHYVPAHTNIKATIKFDNVVVHAACNSAFGRKTYTRIRYSAYNFGLDDINPEYFRMYYTHLNPVSTMIDSFTKEKELGAWIRPWSKTWSEDVLKDTSFEFKNDTDYGKFVTNYLGFDFIIRGQPSEQGDTRADVTFSGRIQITNN